jgi:hypothetical protein
MAVSTIDALYHSGSEKLTTSATGITVTGTVAATAYTGDGSALTGTGSPSIVDNGNATAITIDSSENVGIGTSSPNADLVVTQSGATFTPSSQTVALFQRNSASGSGAKVCILAGNLSSSDLNFGDVDSEDQGRLRYEHNNDAMTFTTNGSERMRINANGSKDFGSFQAFSGGYNTIIGAGSAASYALRLDATGTGSAGVLQVVNGYGQVGSISVSGASTSFNTSSDYRLKTDLQPMTGASARIQSLNPVNFEWIAAGTRTDGFLAHEAQEVVPEAVVGNKDAMRDEPYEVTPAVEATYDDDGNELTAAVKAVMGTRSVPDHQSIDQSKLVPLLTAALQEALTEIASLKTRVEALEA